MFNTHITNISTKVPTELLDSLGETYFLAHKMFKKQLIKDLEKGKSRKFQSEYSQTVVMYV